LHHLLKMKSPSKTALEPKEQAAAARREVGAAFDAGMQKQWSRARKKLKREKEARIVPNALRGSFGGVVAWAAQREKEAISDFGIHSVYVCGEPRIDSDKQEICIAFSNENLLLNAYRQSISSVPTSIMVDTTPRLVLEGHNNMLFGCVDARQRFHTIGYGVCSSKDPGGTQAYHVLPQE